MPGLVVHLGATVICMHGGLAQPLPLSPRVLVSGQQVVTLATPYDVIVVRAREHIDAALRHRAMDHGATRVLASGRR